MRGSGKALLGLMLHPRERKQVTGAKVGPSWFLKWDEGRLDERSDVGGLLTLMMVLCAGITPRILLGLPAPLRWRVICDPFASCSQLPQLSMRAVTFSP